MIKKIILFIAFATFTFAENKRLSFDDVQGKSPFEYPSLGIITWFPGENAFLTKDNNDLFKVSVPSFDTTLFLSKSDFKVVKNTESNKRQNAPWVQTIEDANQTIVPSNIIFSPDGSTLLFVTDKERVWRRSFYGTYYFMNLDSKKISPLTRDSKRLRNVKFSPDGKKADTTVIAIVQALGLIN